MTRSETIGQRIEARRVELGMTRRKLSDDANITEATVYRIERMGQQPDVSTLDRMAAALQITIAELMK